MDRHGKIYVLVEFLLQVPAIVLAVLVFAILAFLAVALFRWATRD